MVRKQHAAKDAPRRQARNGKSYKTVSRFLRGSIGANRPQAEVIEELAQHFLKIRDPKKHLLLPLDLPPSQVIAAFLEIIREEGINPEEFYTLVLERMLAEAELGDGSQGQSKPTAKSRILDAAFEVFTKKGFHIATVDEIAERAGVGKGTLYRYFANKEALFNELVRLRLEELEENALVVLDGHDDVLTMITKYLRIYFEFFDRNQRLYRLIVQEHLDVGDQVEDLYVKRVMRRIPLLKRKIYEASQNGVLKDIDFQTVFFGTMGFIHGVIQKWLAHECSYSLVDELPAVTEVLFHGFCANRQSMNEKI